MRIAGANVVPYALPLVGPIPGGALHERERRGVLIGLQLDTGETEWGEVAPLPGFSPETLEEASAQLDDLLPVLESLGSFEEREPWSQVLLPALAGFNLHASVRFGVETALLNAAACAWHAPWHRRLTGTYRPRVYLNALLAGDRKHIRLDAATSHAAGFRCMKIKVGAGDPAQDAAIVREVYEAVDADTTIRLDANRAWSLDQFFEFAGGVNDLPIEYIEEPVRHERDLAMAAEQGGIPIALDESLLTLSDEAIRDLHRVQAIIIKPTLQYGISGALGLSRLAYDIGAVPVISSAFESGVGLRALLQLAAVVNETDTPVGLSTYRWLAGDVLVNRIDIHRGVLNVDREVTFPTALDIGRR